MSGDPEGWCETLIRTFVCSPVLLKMSGLQWRCYPLWIKLWKSAESSSKQALFSVWDSHMSWGRRRWPRLTVLSWKLKDNYHKYGKIKSHEVRLPFLHSGPEDTSCPRAREQSFQNNHFLLSRHVLFLSQPWRLVMWKGNKFILIQ